MKVLVKKEGEWNVVILRKDNMQQISRGTIDDFYNDLFIISKLFKEPIEIEFYD